VNPDAQRSLIAIALMAAFADGDKSDAERAEVRRIAENLGAQAAGLNLSAVMQDVLLRRMTVAQAVAGLTDPAQRQLAYELAVCVCDADGVQSAAEREFLAALKVALAGPGQALDTGFEAQADALAGMIDAPAGASATPAAPAAAPAFGAAGAATAAAASAPPAAIPANAVLVLDAAQRATLEKSILNNAILCGALELLPQSWASVAIIPLQVRLVYAVGKAHGVALDQGHIKEFIATAGVGMASQYLEQFGRKLLGGLLGKVGGGLGRSIGSAGAGMAMSFATTYALGHLALRYYGGGRQMSAAVLRQTFQELLGPARQLQQQVLPQIEQRARTLDAATVMKLVRQPLA
jgi:uncharacterized protein (DUF697 family)/tellurite resistance protein